jgi:predicted transcriptional regulator
MWTIELTLSVASRENVTRRALAAMAGADQGAHLSFETVEQLRRTLSPARGVCFPYDAVHVDFMVQAQVA